MNEFSRRTMLTGAAAAPLGSLSAQETAQRLNLIHIGVDTWGAEWLGCFGHPTVRTPNVDALAAKAAVFTEAFPEVLPTIPARRGIYTGRRIFPSDLVLQRDDQVKIRGWHPLYAEDVTISETLKAAGYVTSFVSDVYHQFKPDKNFHRGFDAWHWVRGQEADRVETGPRSAIRLDDYLHRSQTGTGPLQYLLNRKDWKTEDDWTCARVFREGARWLRNNAAENQPFYLHLESFSPHEHWDPPEDYYRAYMKSDYKGPRLIAPPPVTKNMTPVEVEHVRALYAGLVTFVDAQIGKFIKQVESQGLLKNTIIVFVADHGTFMGEQGQLHKGETRLRTQVTNVPLFIYHPNRTWAGRRVSGFVQHTDLAPTLLELLRVKTPDRMTGESLAGLVDSGRNSTRETIVTGWGEHGSVRTVEWNYIGRWSPGASFEELYDLKRDPKELKNAAASHLSVVKELRERLTAHVDGGWPATRGTFAKII